MAAPSQALHAHVICEFPSLSTHESNADLCSASLERHWFLVQSKPRQERVSLINLERQGYESYLPLFAVQRVVCRKISVVQEPMFARYLFVRFNPKVSGQSWMQIHSTIGVSKLVRFGEQPARVDDALIARIKQSESDQSAAPRSLFAPGDKIMITDGSLAGLEAIYHSQDAEGRAAVFLEILSRRIAARFNLCDLRKVK